MEYSELIDRYAHALALLRPQGNPSLYNSFKTTYIQLKPTYVHELLQKTLDKFTIIPAHVKLVSTFPPGHPIILADQEHLTETIYILYKQKYD